MNNYRNLNDDLFDAALNEALRQLACEQELDAEHILNSYQNEADKATPSRKFQSNMKHLCSQAGKRKASVRIYPRAMRMAVVAITLVVGIGALAVAVAVNTDWDA